MTKRATVAMPKIGHFVLVGSIEPYSCMLSNWFIGRVRWHDAADSVVLVTECDPTGLLRTVDDKAIIRQKEILAVAERKATLLSLKRKAEAIMYSDPAWVEIRRVKVRHYEKLRKLFDEEVAA